MDLSTTILAYVVIGLGAASLTQLRRFQGTRRSYLQLVAGTIAAAVILNGISFMGTALADHRPTIRPNDVAVAYGMPVDVATTVTFGPAPTAEQRPAYTINPYAPRSTDGKLLVTFFGTNGVPAVFEVPNKKLHLHQTVSASQPTSLTLVLDKYTDLGKRRLIKQGDCQFSMKTAAATCVRQEVFSTTLGANLTTRGLGSIVQDELTSVTLVVPADIYRMLREDRGEG